MDGFLENTKTVHLKYWRRRQTWETHEKTDTSALADGRKQVRKARKPSTQNVRAAG